MFCLSYVHFGAHWYFARIAYVWDNTGPEGVVNALHSQTFAGQMTGSVTFAANIFIADCLFVSELYKDLNETTDYNGLLVL
jgi:hypothetical protein